MDEMVHAMERWANSPRSTVKPLAAADAAGVTQAKATATLSQTAVEAKSSPLLRESAKQYATKHATAPNLANGLMLSMMWDVAVRNWGGTPPVYPADYVDDTGQRFMLLGVNRLLDKPYYIAVEGGEAPPDLWETEPVYQTPQPAPVVPFSPVPARGSAGGTPSLNGLGTDVTDAELLLAHARFYSYAFEGGTRFQFMTSPTVYHPTEWAPGSGDTWTLQTRWGQNAYMVDVSNGHRSPYVMNMMMQWTSPTWYMILGGNSFTRAENIRFMCYGTGGVAYATPLPGVLEPVEDEHLGPFQPDTTAPGVWSYPGAVTTDTTWQDVHDDSTVPLYVPPAIGTDVSLPEPHVNQGDPDPEGFRLSFWENLVGVGRTLFAPTGDSVQYYMHPHIQEAKMHATRLSPAGALSEQLVVVPDGQTGTAREVAIQGQTATLNLAAAMAPIKPYRPLLVALVLTLGGWATWMLFRPQVTV